MSAHSNGLKFRFGGFFKSLFGGTPDVPETNGQSSVTNALATAAPAPASTPVQNYSARTNGNGYGNNSNGSGTQIFSRRPANGGSPGGGDQNHGTGRLIQLSLQSIICVMPPDLRSRVRGAVADGLMITVSVEKILPQLAKGSVKLSFGEIRKSFPQIFADAADADTQLVSLPLGEILPHLKPSMLPQRQAQRHTEVSDDIVGPFGVGGQGVSLSEEKPKPAPAPLPRVAPGTPPAPRQVRPPQDIPNPFQRMQPLQSAQPPVAPRQSIRSVPAPSLAPETPIPFAPVTPISRESAAPAPAPIRVVPTAPSAPKAAPAETAPPMIVPLVSLIGAWPEVIRQEVARLNLSEAQVAIPTMLVDHGLKRGRVAFQWKLLRSWIRPAPLPSISANDGTELELPLSVLAPLFISRRNGAAQKQKVAVDETIPNLFFGFPQAEAAAPVAVAQPVAEPLAVETEAPAAKPTDTNYYVWDETNDTAPTETAIFRRTANTDFKSRQATPQEIITQAASLDGVVGALIALPDGLKVASHIPADLNGDTLAAFLPQLFNKMIQCTRELRMGELNNLNFTVGNVPWKIFRVNAVFFAAFGRVGQPLPTAQLASLAALLDRKNK